MKEICGIYMILNKINNKMYIGQSKNIIKRWKSHKYALNSKITRHTNKNFKKDWDIYGEDNFEFLILEKCLPSELNRLESRYIKKYDAHNKGYNIGKLLDYDSLTENEVNDYKKIVLSTFAKYDDKAKFDIDNVADVIHISKNDLLVVLSYIDYKDELKYNVSISTEFLENVIYVRKLDILQEEIDNVMINFCL